MSAEELASTLRQALIALGVLFIIVDLKVGSEILKWWRIRGNAVLVWPPPKPPFFGINMTIGVLLGILLFVTAYRLKDPASSLFGLAMMFIYYGYLLPLSTRIRRGLYQDGIWTDTGFIPYGYIGGLTWKGENTLVLASREKEIARRLVVPGPHLGEVRHLLREQIARHTIEFDEGPGLHLGTRDTRESA
jgi:hypothetical protein